MGLLRKNCPHCLGKLETGQRIHQACIDPWSEAQEAKAKRAAEKMARAAAKVERDSIKARKEAIKTLADLKREAQTAINRYVRARDFRAGCISCDKPANWGGQWHASHFRSVGAAPQLRFCLWNIHKSCSVCNNYLSGNIREYEIRLREKVGAEKLGYLLSENGVRKYNREYLARLKRVFSRKARRQENRNAS